MSKIVLLFCLLQASFRFSMSQNDGSHASSSGSSFDTEHNGSMYYAMRTLSSFQETFDWCESLGGRLPSVHNTADMDFLIDKMQMGNIWLGGFQVTDGRYGVSNIWTDGSAWSSRLPTNFQSLSSCGPGTCCGLYLSIRKKISSKNRCDSNNMMYRVCRVPSQLKKLDDKVTELESVLSTRSAVDQGLYQTLINRSLIHEDELVRMDAVQSGLTEEVRKLVLLVVDLEAQRNATNHSLTEQVMSLNESIHSKLHQVHHHVNTSGESFNFSLTQQYDLMQTLINHSQELARQQSRAQKQEQVMQISYLKADIHLLTAAIVISILFFSLVPLVVWIKMRKRTDLQDDEVRLSHINDTY